MDRWPNLTEDAATAVEVVVLADGARSGVSSAMPLRRDRASVAATGCTRKAGTWTECGVDARSTRMGNVFRNGGAQHAVRNRRGRDQTFLRGLSSHVAAVDVIGAERREDDVMPDAGCTYGGQAVRVLRTSSGVVVVR